MTDGYLHDAATAALAKIDDVARRSLAWAAPIRFALAETSAEREAVYRLRYQAVIEHSWHRPQDFPDGLERDKYDEHAVHIAGWDGAVLAATSRLVFPSDGNLLPTEEAFELRVEPRGQVVDAGRFVVARTHSDMEHRVLAGLLGWSWLAVRARGFAIVCSAFASLPMIRLYQRMGSKMTILAAPRHYWGEVRYPIRWEVLDFAETLSERWRNLENGAPPAPHARG
jgi:N-acyl-L-homoserine lactone synthetase